MRGPRSGPYGNHERRENQDLAGDSRGTILRAMRSFFEQKQTEGTKKENREWVSRLNLPFFPSVQNSSFRFLAALASALGECWLRGDISSLDSPWSSARCLFLTMTRIVVVPKSKVSAWSAERTLPEPRKRRKTRKSGCRFLLDHSAGDAFF